MKKKRPSYVENFKKELIELIQKYGLTVKYYRIEYDEYDSDGGWGLCDLDDWQGLTINDINYL